MIYYIREELNWKGFVCDECGGKGRKCDEKCSWKIRCPHPECCRGSYLCPKCKVETISIKNVTDYNKNKGL